MKSSNKTSTSGIFFITISTILVVLIGLFIYVTVFSSDAVNRRNGVPESGWGALVGGIILIVAILIFGIVDIIVGLVYLLNKTNKPKQLIKPNDVDVDENKNIKVG